jgi:hypothetical protein
VKNKTNEKAGGVSLQHNRAAKRGLKVKTDVKAGAGAGKVSMQDFHFVMQHNQTVKRGLKVKTNVKAGNGTGKVSMQDFHFVMRHN